MRRKNVFKTYFRAFHLRMRSPWQERIQKVLVERGCDFKLGWMLTKYKDEHTRKREKISPFKMFHVRGLFRIFFRERHQISSLFQAQSFPGRVILSNLSNKNDFREVRGHASPRNFWKFAYCNGHFSAFRTIFGQGLFTFLAPTFECFIKYDAFCKHSFDYACLRRLRFIVMNWGANLCWALGEMI